MGSAWVKGWRDEQRESHGELMSDREQVSGGDSQEEGSARRVEAEGEDEREGVPAWERTGGTQGWRGSDAASRSGRSSRSCPGGRPPRRSCRRRHMFRDNVSANVLWASDSSINLLFSWLNLCWTLALNPKSTELCYQYVCVYAYVQWIYSIFTELVVMICSSYTHHLCSNITSD